MHASSACSIRRSPITGGTIARFESNVLAKPRGVRVPSSGVEIGGVASRPPARYLELSKEQVTGDVWQNFSIERYAAASGLALLPVVVLQDPASPALAAG